MRSALPLVLVLGDSISAGYGIQRDSGWVSLLAERLASGARRGTVVNASISGETTGGGLARVDSALAHHDPDIVIVELGGNDGLRGYPTAQIEANLMAIAQRARATGARVIVVGMQIPPNYGPRYATAFRDLFAAVAARTDSALVPFLLDGVAIDRTLMQADGIHPTAAAQPRLLANLWPVLEPLLDPNLEPQSSVSRATWDDVGTPNDGRSASPTVTRIDAAAQPSR